MIVVASSNPLLTSCGELGTRHNAGRPDWRFRQREPIETQHESKRSFEAPLQYVIVQKRPNRLLSQHRSAGLNGLLPVEFGVVGHRRGPRDTAIAAPALAPAFPLAVAQLSRGRLGLLLPDSAHSAGQPW